jgi:hypothetical protein
LFGVIINRIFVKNKRVSKIDNYIILSIAEKAYKQFKKTKYSTYSSFCKKLGLSIQSSTLTQKEKMLIYEIVDEIEIIFGLKEIDIWTYVVYFFTLEVNELAEYNKYMKMMENFHPLLFIDI